MVYIYVSGFLQCIYNSYQFFSCVCNSCIIAAFNAEGRPIWKPMHMQPIYRMNHFITRNGSGRARSNAYIKGIDIFDVGADIFSRGLCLPSENKMTKDQQNIIIEIIHKCFL